MGPVRVGVVGCGNISAVYFRNLARFELTQVIACADLVPEKAQQAADQYGIPLVLSTEELIHHPDVDLVLNLTVPKAHSVVSLEAVRAGKHVYSEKPLAVTREEGRAIIEEAARQGVRVGCAPDTFLGAAHQTCRQLVDEGVIGAPVGGAAFMLCHGHESWHPSPEFYYEVGGGPMLDMGPYYLTAMVNLLGPIRSVTGSVRTTFPERVITSQPKAGKVIQVETPTHIAGILEFECGAVGTIITSFDVWASVLPRIELWGTEGSLLVPDPNAFGGTILLRKQDEHDWHEVPVTRPFAGQARGLGVADMVAGILTRARHRASGTLAMHVLDAMLGFQEASETRAHYLLSSAGIRPDALPADQFEETESGWRFNAGT